MKILERIAKTKINPMSFGVHNQPKLGVHNQPKWFNRYKIGAYSKFEKFSMSRF